MPYRKAASVFPEPVGAWISVCLPLAIAGQPCSCAGVGPSKVRSNHSRVSGLKTESADTPSSLATAGQSKSTSIPNNGEMREARLLAAGFALVVWLAACGGGGDSAEPPTLELQLSEQSRSGQSGTAM